MAMIAESFGSGGIEQDAEMNVMSGGAEIGGHSVGEHIGIVYFVPVSSRGSSDCICDFLTFLREDIMTFDQLDNFGRGGPGFFDLDLAGGRTGGGGRKGEDHEGEKPDAGVSEYRFSVSGRGGFSMHRK